MLTPGKAVRFDPYFLPQYLRLNDAIERFTADMVAHDRGAFRGGGGDIRYVAERQLFFTLFADRKLYDYFVACSTQAALPNEESLPFWSRWVAPYFRGERPRFETLTWRERYQRFLYRRLGEGLVRIEGTAGTRPQVLFHVIHPKFVRYLKSIADNLSVPFAFLTIDDPGMFDALAAEGLPRVHIVLTQASHAMMLPEVEIIRRKFRPGLFDSWFIRFNAVRRVLRELGPDCIVLPEGNAPIYELVNQSAKAIGVRTLCVQQGWAPVVHPGFRNMSYGTMCVWGEEFARLLAPFNPKQRFVAAGNHIIFCEPQGNVGQRNAIAFFLQNGAHWLTEEAWRGMLDLIAWSARRFPRCEIRVREHPGEPLAPADEERLKAAGNVKLMSPGEFSLKDLFAGCRVAVAINSTTILEAAASGAVPLILDVSGFGPYHPNIAGEGAAVEVTNFEDAKAALERLVQDDQYCTSFASSLDRARESLFAKNGKQALDAIVEEINLMVGA
jgi:hypothetical protein